MVPASLYHPGTAHALVPSSLHRPGREGRPAPTPRRHLPWRRPTSLRTTQGPPYLLTGARFSSNLEAFGAVQSAEASRHARDLTYIGTHRGRPRLPVHNYIKETAPSGSTYTRERKQMTPKRTPDRQASAVHFQTGRHGRPLSLHTPRLQPHALALLCSAPRAAHFCTRERRKRGGVGADWGFANHLRAVAGRHRSGVPTFGLFAPSLTLEVCAPPSPPRARRARADARLTLRGSHCARVCEQRRAGRRRLREAASRDRCEQLASTAGLGTAAH